MSSGSYTLLDNVAATGPSVSIAFAGQYLYEVMGTFGTGTIALEVLGPDNVTWLPMKDINGALVSDTAADVAIVELPAGGIVRASVTGGTPANLRARLRWVGA